MLKLTKKSDYGLIALRHLAVGPRKSSASTKEIAEAYKIPVQLLAKVLQSLSRAGFVVSEAGAAGGYKLSRDPRTITALEVIRAIDGPVLLASCFHDDASCHQHEVCTVKEPLRKVHEGILRLLDGISIFDLSTDGFELPHIGPPLWQIRAAVPPPVSTEV